MDFHRVQGLGALLFIIYLNDMLQVVEKCEVVLHMYVYADDAHILYTQMFRKFEKRR